MPALLTTLRLYRRLDRGAGGLRGRLRRAVGAVLCEALDDDAQAALTLGLYDRPGPKRESLFAWERPWLAALPPGPVLVGGAGAGREVAALRALGHPVHAAEPVVGLAGRLHAERVIVADYAGLTEATLGDEPALGLAPPYAAVLLGWGSLTHVLRAEDRRRLLEACHRLCPEGPILASFWLRGSPQDAGESPLARRIGRAVGALRGRSPAPERQFAPWCGFGERLSVGEVEGLGRRLGRRVVWGAGPYPHAAWWPGA